MLLLTDNRIAVDLSWRYNADNKTRFIK